MNRPFGNHITIRCACMKALDLTMKCIRFHECMGILSQSGSTEPCLRRIIPRGHFARRLCILHPFLNRSWRLIPLELNGLAAHPAGQCV